MQLAEGVLLGKIPLKRTTLKTAVIRGGMMFFSPQEAQELLVSHAGFVMCELQRKPPYELEVRMCLTCTETKISIAGKAHSWHSLEMKQCFLEYQAKAFFFFSKEWEL